jgi:hypothetical protein
MAKSTRLSQYIHSRYAGLFQGGGVKRTELADVAGEINLYIDEMSELHAALFEGKKTEIDALVNDTTDEYYSYLLANNARCEKLKREMEKAKNRSL